MNLAFVVGSLIPSLFLDKIGRKKPMMAGAFGMGISMMMIAIMLSFKGTVHEGPTATASIAFFFTVSFSGPFARDCQKLFLSKANATLPVHDMLRRFLEWNSMVLLYGDFASQVQRPRHGARRQQQLALGEIPPPTISRSHSLTCSRCSSLFISHPC